MNSTFLIKVKFETSNQIYDFKLTDTNTPTFFEQQEKYLISLGFENEKKIYSLFNTQHQKFFICTNEIKSSSTNSSVHILKNCNDFSKKIVQDMYKYLNSYKENLRRVSSLNQISSSNTNELKNVVFSLQNYFLIDGFTEEFIAFDGIEKLIEIMEISTGHTKVSFLLKLFRLMHY